jgi:hypothetical protein
VVSFTPRPLYPLYRRLGGPQSRCGPSVVQPVATAAVPAPTESLRSNKTSAHFYRTTRRHIPEDRSPHCQSLAGKPLSTCAILLVLSHGSRAASDPRSSACSRVMTAVRLQTCILEVLGSHLVQDTGYPN